MAVAFQYFNSFSEAAPEKIHNLGSDTLKIMLSAVAPVATNTQKSDLTEIAAGSGYLAGGTAATVTTSSQSAGTYTLAANQVVFTASGGAIAAFRYATLYNDTAANDELIGFWDYGSSLTLNDGDSLSIKFNSTSPGTILTITHA